MKNYDEQNGYSYTHYTSPGPGPQNGGRPARKDDFWETVSWIVDVALIFLWFPVGLGLTVIHGLGLDLVGKVLDGLRSLGGGMQRRAETPAPQKRAEAPGAAQEEPAAPQAEAEKAAAQPAIRRADRGAKVKSVFGWILAAFGLGGALSRWEVSAWAGLTYLAISLGGGSLILSAGMGRKKERVFRQCFKVIGEAGVINIGKLGRTMGWKGAAADRNLTDMIDRGYFGQRAYIDHERGLLVIRPEDLQYVYHAEEMEAAARKSAQAAKKTAGETEYTRYIEAIRQADEDIADEAMSEKIRRMQTVTAAIFQEVEAHPEKKPQIERFMNYYLPTTLKLLNSYAHIERQGVSGENMAKARADIERIADTLVEGYEKQLDTLYRAEAMDIAGDVSVIENMMKRDGLAGGRDFGEALGGH